MERGQEEPYEEETHDSHEKEDCPYAHDEFMSQSHHLQELTILYEEQLIDQSEDACIDNITLGEWHEVAPPEICSEIEYDEDWCLL